MVLSDIKKGQLSDEITLYRIHNLVNEYNYIGIAEGGMNNRLFSNKYGYIMYYNKGRKHNIQIDSRIPDILLGINDAILKYGAENFDLVLEGIPSDSNSEEILIKKYNSVIYGYNKTLDGLGASETKYKLGYFTDGLVSSMLPLDLEDEILKIPGVIKGYTVKGSRSKDMPGPLKGRIWMTDGISSKAILPLEEKFYSDLNWKRGRTLNIDKFEVYNNGIVNKNIPLGSDVPDGFVKGRIESSIKGRVAIHKDGVTSYVNPDEVGDKEVEGYSLGRVSSGMKNLRIINNGLDEISVNITELKSYLDSGIWSLGHLDSFKSKMNGKITINNGVTEKRVDPEELDTWISKDYKLGGLPNSNRSTTKGRKYMNNGIISKLVPESDIKKFLDEGYVFGMLPRRNKLNINQD